MGGEKKRSDNIMECKSKQKQSGEQLVPNKEDKAKAMADHEVEIGEGKIQAGVGAGADPAAAVDGIMLDMDGENLIFSEDTFPSFPDFPCLSSPSASPSPSSPSTFHAKNTLLSSCPSTSSSSSSSSSWSFLQVPDGSRAADMQQQQQGEVPSVDDGAMLAPALFDHHQLSEFSDGLDILGDIDLFDLSVDPWDPSSLLIHAQETGMAADNAGDDMASPGMKPCDVAEQGHSHGHGDGEEVLMQQEEENSSEDLARIFLEWLRSNKDSISPEDLRNIKLKRATIECAARRLGRTKQGRTQLLKLILTWVQNNHLQRKRQQQRPPLPYDHHQLQSAPFPVTPNPNQLHYNYSTTTDSNLAPRCNPWLPYSMDPSAGVPPPALLTTYGGEMMYPGAAASNYPYHHGFGGNSSSVMVSSQPFSPSPDFVDPAAGPWTTQLASAVPSFGPLPGALSMMPAQYSRGFANQFLGGHPMYHQGQGLTGVASATKEARKKRMAHQRRFSSLHHHRNQNQQHSHHPVVPTEAANVTSRSWAFWNNMSSSSSSHQMNHIAETQNSSNTQQTQPPSTPVQQKPPQHSGASTSEKRQGWKGEKNLKFLLQKVLKQSDVGSLGRIVLPKKEAETHLPELDARDGISIPMEDIGTSQVWNMRYRFWPNNKSRMYLLENTGDFVRSNGLQEGDFIVIYSDVKCGKYMIRGVKVRQPAELRQPSGRNAGKAHQKRNGLEKMGSAGKLKRSSCHDVDEDADMEEDA